MNELQQLGASRVEEIKAKWPDLSTTSVGEETSAALFSLSDFIFQSACRYQNIAQTFLCINSQSELLQRGLLELDQYKTWSEAEITQQLRRYRHYWYSLIAARDFLKLCPIDDTMREISFSADYFYTLARDWAVEQFKPRWGEALDANGNRVTLIALGMGKLGGGELNFSSDIDLIFCYASKGKTSGGRKSEDFQPYFTKLAQKVIALLDAVTPDGRVFRVDMRLRPFGDSGPLVSSFDAIEDYYQEQGREWERYALLKARPLFVESLCSQTEREQQKQLTNLLKPFVYRRYIDFSVIDSLRNMKTMIRSEVRRRNLVGNIKLGEGGIREVEFIVQSLQMLRGGKQQELQTPSLLSALETLVSMNMFSQQEADDLKQSYFTLRQIEQYLQAFSDQQTQTLPTDSTDQLRLNYLLSTKSWSETLTFVDSVMAQVSGLFTEVIGDPENEQKSEPKEFKHWTQVWQSVDQNDSGLENTELVGYLQGLKKDILNIHCGARGQDKLQQLIPYLLAECELQQSSLNSIAAVFNLIKKIATRTTYLELLLENDGARKQLVKLLSASEFVGAQLLRFPLLLDQLIDPKLLYQAPNEDDYLSQLRQQLLRVESDDLELQMEVLRQFKLSNQLNIAACDIEGVIDLPKVSDNLTALAQACLTMTVDLAWQQMVTRYGYPVGADAEHKNFGVIAYGKMAGFELGYGSDLDIVFVHNCESSKGTSGPKEIDSRQFYIKLVQRIMHIFTTKTLSGDLYELDTRLRPSGASGLLAINIKTFEEYQTQEAWAWEHQALVRSRFILGEEGLAEQFTEIRQQVLQNSRHKANLAEEVSAMRKKMFDNLNKAKDGEFDLKQSRGGIADIEFISQFLVLNFSNTHQALLTYPDNLRILDAAQQAGLIDQEQKKALIDAYLNYRHYYHQASLNDEKKVVNQELVVDDVTAVSKVWQQVGLD